MTAGVTVKVIWEAAERTTGLCPGGCGMIHRTCCDSVLGAEHQTRCHFENPMLEAGVPRRPWWGRAVMALRRGRR